MVPLYLPMSDTAGALAFFVRYEQAVSDDTDDPLHLYGWTLSRYRTSERDKAAAKLCQTMRSNLYLIPHILGVDQDAIDM